MLKARTRIWPRASLVAALLSAVLLVGLGQPASGLRSAVISTVVVDKGLAYGYQLTVSIFGGPTNTRGYGQIACIASNPSTQGIPPGCAPNPAASSTPSVELPLQGGSVTQTDADGSTGSVGPAVIHSSGATTVSTQGTTGAGGSVTTSTSTNNVNRSGQEQFTATNLASSCTASASGVSGSTTVTGGTLETDSGEDLNDDGDYVDPGEHAPVVVTVPTNPAPNTQITGHLHVNGVTDTWRYVFNEQVLNPDGSITVYAAHQYILGPTAVGHLYVGRADCGVVAISV